MAAAICCIRPVPGDRASTHLAEYRPYSTASTAAPKESQSARVIPSSQIPVPREPRRRRLESGLTYDLNLAPARRSANTPGNRCFLVFPATVLRTRADPRRPSEPAGRRTHGTPGRWDDGEPKQAFGRRGRNERA